MTCGDDDESSCTHTHTTINRTADRTTNLLIFSNFHFVHLVEIITFAWKMYYCIKGVFMSEGVHFHV